MCCCCFGICLLVLLNDISLFNWHIFPLCFPYFFYLSFLPSFTLFLFNWITQGLLRGMEILNFDTLAPLTANFSAERTIAIYCTRSQEKTLAVFSTMPISYWIWFVNNNNNDNNKYISWKLFKLQDSSYLHFALPSPVCTSTFPNFMSSSHSPESEVSPSVLL